MRQQERLCLPPAAGTICLFLPHRGMNPGQVGAAKQHRGDLEHKLLGKPFIHIQMSFFVQRKLEIRVIQIPLLCCPLRFNCLFPLNRSRQRAHSPCTNAFARSVIRTSSPSGSAVKLAVTGCSILAPAKSPCRQITGKLCMVRLCAGCDKLSQVKLHSTPHKRLLC